MAKSYAAMKAAVRELAIDWQLAAADQNLSYGELADSMAYFERVGRRYGLLQEFRENAIL